MTDLITRAKAALDGVTEGPWDVQYERGTTQLHMAGAKDVCQMCDETYYPWVPENLNDWEFIAAARTLVPELVAGLEAAQRREEDANRAAFRHLARAQKAEAENAKLRDALRPFAEVLSVYKIQPPQLILLSEDNPKARRLAHLLPEHFENGPRSNWR